MEKNSKTDIVIEYAIFSLLMYLVIQCAIYWGIYEKSLWSRTWEFFTGGTIGLISGVGFFIVFGSIGYVCGPIYGAIGLLGLGTMGAIGGLGLGAIINIMRNPNYYRFEWEVILPTLLMGGIIAKFLARQIRIIVVEYFILIDNPIDRKQYTYDSLKFPLAIIPIMIAIGHIVDKWITFIYDRDRNRISSIWHIGFINEIIVDLTYFILIGILLMCGWLIILKVKENKILPILLIIISLWMIFSPLLCSIILPRRSYIEYQLLLGWVNGDAGVHLVKAFMLLGGILSIISNRTKKKLLQFGYKLL